MRCALGLLPVILSIACSRHAAPVPPLQAPQAQLAPVPPLRPPGAQIPALDPWQALGKELFFDPGLSVPAGQSCASCHDPATAFSDPQHRALSPGAAPGTFGARNAPTLLYALHVPVLGLTEDDDALPPAPEGDAHAQEVREENSPLQTAGGLFLDGRADTLEAQVSGPIFNPREMNNATATDLARRLRAAPYAPRFAELVGPQVLDKPDTALKWAFSALAAYERSAEFAPFASRYDRFLAGKAQLTPQEREGLDIFENPKRANCASCHPNRPQPHDTCAPLLTDHSYHNLGWSKIGDGAPDEGLKGTTGKAEDIGKFRTPSLRNIAKTAPYFHDGRFKTLREVVDFYADRDFPEGVKRFGLPAFPATVETRRTGKLKLTEAEREALVAFLKTLDDE